MFKRLSVDRVKEDQVVPELSSIPSAIWALRGETNLRVECWITESGPRQCDLAVTYGSATVLDESYPDRASAEVRARAIREQLLANGWKSP